MSREPARTVLQRLRALLVIAAIACGWVLAPASAQRIDPQPAGLIDFAVTLDVRHEGNIAHVSEEAARDRGIEPEDQRFRPAAEVRIERPLGQHFIKAAAVLGYDFHVQNSWLNRARVGASAEVGLNFTTCQFKTLGEFKRQQSQFRDLGDGVSVVDNGYGLVANSETHMIAGGSATCGGAVGLRPFVSVNYEKADNSDVARQAADNSNFTYAAGLGYSHPFIGNAHLYASRSEYRYENQVLPTGEQRGLDVTRAGLHLEREVGTRFRIAADVSIPWIDTREAGTPSVDGLNWSLDVTVKPTERLTFRTIAAREISTSLLSDSLYNRSATFLASLTYAISPFTSLKAGVNVKKRDYYGVDDRFGPELNNDRLELYQITASHKINRRLRLSALVSHERRDANGTYFDYESENAMLRLDFRM